MSSKESTPLSKVPTISSAVTLDSSSVMTPNKTDVSVSFVTTFRYSVETPAKTGRAVRVADWCFVSRLEWEWRKYGFISFISQLLLTFCLWFSNFSWGMIRIEEQFCLKVKNMFLMHSNHLSCLINKDVETNQSSPTKQKTKLKWLYASSWD